MNRPSSLARRAQATPRVQLRGANAYWEPSRSLRAAGFASVALGALTVEALNRADQLNASADAYLARARAARERPERPAFLTMADLFEAYRKSRAFAAKAPATRRHYAQHLGVLEAHFGPEAVAAVTPKAVQGWLDALTARSPRHAHNVYRTLRLVLGWAVIEGLCPSNPAARIGASTPRPRRRIATREELAALIETADAMGRPSIGDFCVIAVTTMQRVGDVLALSDENFRDGHVELAQAKTGKELSFAPHPALTARLGPLARRTGPWVRSEETGRAYAYDTFSHWFHAVRAEAARRLPSLLGQDRRVRDPNLRGPLWAEDFRRTGMVWAAQGGAEVLQIVSVSGHEIRNGTKILETYLPKDRALAAQALGALSIEPAAPQAKGAA